MASIAGLDASSAIDAKFSSRIDRLFSKNDQDKDGTLSRSEFTSAVQKLPGQTADSTGPSGAGPSSLFNQIDSDANGSITKDELSTFQKEQVAQMRSAMLNLQEVFGGSQGGQNSYAHRGGVSGHHHGHSRHPGPLQASSSSQDTTSGAASSPTSQATDSTASPADTLMKLLDANSDGAISKGEISSFLDGIAAHIPT